MLSKMSKKTAVLLLMLLLAAALFGAGTMYRDLKDSVDPGTAGAAQSGEEEVSYTAPDFNFRDGAGNEYWLSDFVGKPTVVNFWTSWCTYCVGDMPNFQEAFDTYGEEINFLMVNLTSYMGDSREKADAIIEEGKYTFPVYYDTSGGAVNAYGIRGVPLSLFIDAEGNLVTYANGALEAELLEKALGYIYEGE